MLISISSLRKIYQMGEVEVRALDGVDLEVEAGEYVAIMGPSGSGKSTLMNLIGCLDTPTSGEYILNNQRVSDLDDGELASIRNHEIGFVFQTFNLLARATALANVELPLIYARVPAKERHRRAREVLERVGLGDADEPTGNLDSKTSQEIMELFDELNAAGNTLIVVTHEEDIAAHARRVVRMLDGKILVDEKVRESKVLS